MKLTNSKLKQLIKEVAEEGFETESEQPEWTSEVEELLEQAADLYDSLPDEGKEHMTQNFEEYAERWREERGEESDEAWDSEEDEGEYEMLPRGEDPMGRGAQTSQLRRKSTNWRPGEDFSGIE